MVWGSWCVDVFKTHPSRHFSFDSGWFWITGVLIQAGVAGSSLLGFLFAEPFTDPNHSTILWFLLERFRCCCHFYASVFVSEILIFQWFAV